MKRTFLAAASALCIACATASASTYNFQTINNPADPNFNQLLGINNAGVIAGYFGDGAVVPNNGYTWTKSGGFVAENYNGAAQTQVVGINNTKTNGTYNTVGFYVDAAGANHGFSQIGGTQTTVDHSGSMGFNQLLGINDSNIAVGFYVDALNVSHGYEVNLSTNHFTDLSITGATSVTATAINNAGWIAGFYSDAIGNTHGFLDENGTYKILDYPMGVGVNTSIFGMNNKGQLVGSFLNANDGTNGFVYNVNTNSWQTVSDPNAQFLTAFGVSGTVLNGINDAGDLVGFYSDGTHVNGLLATPTPEPASLGFLLIGGGLAAVGVVKRRKR